MGRAHDVLSETRVDGTILLRSRATLGPVAERTTDWLDHWSEKTPDAVFLAERSGAGWREVGYSEAHDTARALAFGLLGLGIGPGKPILVISGNGVDHGLLSLAAQYIGAPVVPLAEQYALISEARHHIDFIASLIQPGAVFAEDGDVLADVLGRDALRQMIKLVSKGGGADTVSLSRLAATAGDIAQAQTKVGPDTIAKILMTSGSTSRPKGVPTTHRMMCVNQAQIAHALPFLTEHPPVIVDWLPWNHVFGGSHNFNMMLANGGALYIDGGKPIPHLIGKTIENLGLKAGTLTFNVPAGFAMIRDALRKDEGLRRRYFEHLDLLFYAGSSLPQDVWSDLEDMARDVRGNLPLFTSSYGLTETAPAHILQRQPTTRSGVIGVPLPEAEVKLIPETDGRFEVRVRGPNVFSHYWNDPKQSKAAFDEEGYFITGDAMQFVDPSDPNQGLRFDGRLSEEFKLLTGTWVRAAGLRLTVLAALGDVAADIIVVGADRAEIGVFLIPTGETRQAPDATEQDGALVIPSVQDAVRRALQGIGGSNSTRVARAMILAEPLSMAAGEVTAKGSINQRALLNRRAALLERLFDDGDAATIRIVGEDMG